MSSEQPCQQCGRCCERWGWGQKGVVTDLIPWITGNRQDILKHVSLRFSDGTCGSGNDLSVEELPRVVLIHYWQDTRGKLLHHCPFFRRSQEGSACCAIHDCKPAVCKEFRPWTWKNHEFHGSCPACREGAP